MKKKLDKNTALAKIKTIISKFYENAGREIIDMDEERKNLIDDIDEILENVDIETKNLIIEQLELDKKLNRHSP